MKVIVTIEFDTNDGSYDLMFKTAEGNGKIEQAKLAKIIQTALNNWNMKFVD